MIKENKLYRKFDYKKVRKLPDNAIPCQDKPEPITGHFLHWVECSKFNPNDKYHIYAFNKKDVWENGTYELIGLHFQGNPYNLDDDILERHGIKLLDDVPRTY